MTKSSDPETWDRAVSSSILDYRRDLSIYRKYYTHTDTRDSRIKLKSLEYIDVVWEIVCIKTSRSFSTFQDSLTKNNLLIRVGIANTPFRADVFDFWKNIHRRSFTFSRNNVKYLSTYWQPYCSTSASARSILRLCLNQINQVSLLMKKSRRKTLPLQFPKLWQQFTNKSRSKNDNYDHRFIVELYRYTNDPWYKEWPTYIWNAVEQRRKFSAARAVTKHRESSIKIYRIE